MHPNTQIAGREYADIHLSLLTRQLLAHQGGDIRLRYELVPTLLIPDLEMIHIAHNDHVFIQANHRALLGVQIYTTLVINFVFLNARIQHPAYCNHVAIAGRITALRFNEAVSPLRERLCGVEYEQTLIFRVLSHPEIV